jgi:DNA repair exonuclease SbcCD nuclease subunit
LGHIHQPQSLAGQPHVRYSGSVERLDMGECRDQKSIVRVEIGPQGLLEAPVCLPLEATPFYDVVIDNPEEELPGLRDRYPAPDRALVRYQVTYRAGTDNLEGILRELDSIFPRWYDREWREASSQSQSPGFLVSAPALNFHETVLDYLQVELKDHPDRIALMQLTDALLAEDA